MSGDVQVNAVGGTVTVLVPLRYRKRSGRKVIIGEVRSLQHLNPSRPHNGTHKTILKAFGRAYRWKRMLESGDFASITELATAERINHAYVRRVLRLALLSPEKTEAILDGSVPKGFRLHHLLRICPDVWAEQEELLR